MMTNRTGLRRVSKTTARLLGYASIKEVPFVVNRRGVPVHGVHLCAQCGLDMGNEWILGPVCGKCCRANHRKAVGR